MAFRSFFKRKKLFFWLAVLAIAVFFVIRWKNSPRILGADIEKIAISDFVVLIDDGLVSYADPGSGTDVGNILEKQGITLEKEDVVMPALESPVFSGSTIHIERAKKITLMDGEKEISAVTTSRLVEDVLWENGLEIGEFDIVSPSLESPVVDDAEIKITRVTIKEETKNEPIPFKTATNEDDKLGWREKRVTQKGVAGLKEVTYQVVLHNGKEISRKITGTKIQSEPVTEVVSQGTYVKFGKSHTGQGTWYAWKGGLFAASPWLPMGSFAKVTNRANGQSVIVQINDRGPFGPGRIIDLDKVAFRKIASLGAGVIDVKVEEILN